ncbi:MAG: beta strand repeat-containing protein, partial [Tepidisphaeraceae bacterium]
HTVTLGGTLVSAATADGGLTKSGAGTLTVSSPTYNGPTIATGGTLKITNFTTASPVTASTGGTVQLTNSTITLPASKFLTANAASIIAYDNTTVNANLTGVGTHHVLAGGATFNNAVFTTGTNLLADGATGLNNVTSTATITANAPITWAIGSNTLGTLNANAAVTTNTWYNTGNINISSAGSLTNTGTTLLIGGGSRVTIANGGSLTTTAGTIELNGALLTNNGAVHGTLDVNYGSTVKGSGTFDAVNVSDGGVFSPGNSPGTATVASATFDTGGAYQFEISSAAATPGAGADLLSVTGALNITAGSTANSQFVIHLMSLNSANQSAALTDFDPNQNYAFTLATAGSISGFEADRFFVDTAGFRNTFDGSFGVTQSGNTLMLNYTTAVPEPVALAAVGISAMLGLRRRRKIQNAS